MRHAKVIKWIANLFKGASSGATTAASSSTDTEFTAEVVRITRILPHPNADRLEILRFEMAGIGETSYEVVSQKGTFRPGDLAAYFSVDCLLPTSHPEFAFLTKRPDGAGKEIFRLRAARLRGVFSQGLLVPAPSHLSFGEGCADAFGVTYYRAPEPGVWPSGDGIKAKPRPQPFPVYTVDSLKKLPRLFEEDEPVVVTEKIHGTNFRFGWVRRRFLGIPIGWKFVVGSHRVIKNGRGNHWYGEDVWTEAAEKMDLAGKTWDYRGYTFYGELYGYTYSGKKIQDLTYGRKPEDGPGLVCFDVRTPDGKWCDWFVRRCVLADCGLAEVPTLYTGRVNAVDVRRLAEGESVLARQAKHPTSTMGTGQWISKAQIREGVVIESLHRDRKAKYVGEGYLTRKEAA